MACESCGEKKNVCENKNFTKATVEILNPKELSMFRKVTVPASMGDDITNPPRVGRYCNVILYYEANEQAYLYSSDGIPTKLTGDLSLIKKQIADLQDEDVKIWDEIEIIEASSDVVDVVGTYAELQQYDTSKLHDKDLIKVLQDETHDGAITYYRWSTSTSTFSYVGEEGPYYTQTQVDNLIASTPAFKPFPDSVNTTGTTQQFMNSILALQPESGMAYLGTVSLSDMPAGLTQEEVEVYVYSDYVIYCVMRSTDVKPYQWWCASYNYQGWRPVGGSTTTTFHWGGSPNYSMYKDSDYTTAATYSDIATAYADGLVYIADGEDEVTYVVVSDIPDAHIITVTGIGLPGNEGGSASYEYASSTWTKTSTELQKRLTAGTNITINGTTISATDTTYSDFTGATSGTAGAHGLVPAPAAGDQSKVLKGDGTWGDAAANTIFYMNSSETGGTRHIFKDSAMTSMATSQEVFDANDRGQVILRISTSVDPASYSDAYLQNAYKATGDYQLLFLDEKTYRSFDTTTLSDNTFIYSARVLQDQLTAGTNITITGATISATDTTYSAFTGATTQQAGSAGLVPAPTTSDPDKYLKGDGTWSNLPSANNISSNDWSTLWQ